MGFSKPRPNKEFVAPVLSEGAKCVQTHLFAQVAYMWGVIARFQEPRARLFIAYVMSVLAVAVATVVTDAVPPLHDASSDLFFAVVVVVAWLGGRGPAILACVLSTFAIDYFIISPVYSILFDIADIVRFTIFLFVSLQICYLQDRYQQIAKRLREANSVLEDRVRERTGELAAANQGLMIEIAERESAEAALVASEASLRNALDTVEKSLTEKEILLRELDHRVKNNLQIISSLLSLQASQLQDQRSREFYKECQHRVRAIALVHQKLCGAASVANIDLEAYFGQLVQELLRSYYGGQGTITTDVVVDQTDLSVDQLVPCALVVNELVSNAFKYAFPTGRTGSVRVELRRRDEFIDLTVADNGIGMGHPEDHGKTGVGLQIVQALVEQLSGSVRWTNGQGTSATITFPIVK